MARKLVGLFLFLVLSFSVTVVVFASDYEPEMREVQGITYRISMSEWMEQYLQHNAHSYELFSGDQYLATAALSGGYVYVTEFHFYFCTIYNVLHALDVSDRNRASAFPRGNLVIVAATFAPSNVRWSVTNAIASNVWINGVASLWYSGGIRRDMESLNLSIPSTATMLTLANLDTGNFFLSWGRSEISFMQDGFNHGFVVSLFNPNAF